MKIHKVTAYVFNWENLRDDEVKEILENQKYLGSVRLENFETISLKDFPDEHPANQRKTIMSEWWDANKKP